MVDFSTLVLLLVPYTFLLRVLAPAKPLFGFINVTVFFLFFFASKSHHQNEASLAIAMIALIAISLLCFKVVARKSRSAFLPISLITVGGLLIFKTQMTLPQTFGTTFFFCRLVFYALERSLKKESVTLADFMIYAFSPLLFFVGPITSFQRFTHPTAPTKVDSLTVQRLILGFFKLVFVSQWLFNAGSDSLSHPDYSFRLIDMIFGHLVDIVFVYFYLSGLNDITISLGKFLGHQIDENFNKPFLATNILEYWKRWHMTLSGFVRNAFYTPLSLYFSRKLSRRYRALMNLGLTALSFAFLGFLHFQNSLGLALGLFHLVGVMSCHFFGLAIRKIGIQEALGKSWLYQAFSYSLTWFFISSSMIFFRVGSLNELKLLISHTRDVLLAY